MFPVSVEGNQNHNSPWTIWDQFFLHGVTTHFFLRVKEKCKSGTPWVDLETKTDRSNRFDMRQPVASVENMQVQPSRVISSTPAICVVSDDPKDGTRARSRQTRGQNAWKLLPEKPEGQKSLGISRGQKMFEACKILSSKIVKCQGDAWCWILLSRCQHGWPPCSWWNLILMVVKLIQKIPKSMGFQWVLASPRLRTNFRFVAPRPRTRGHTSKEPRPRDHRQRGFDWGEYIACR